MLTVNKLIPQARGLAPALVRRAAQVELDWDTRQKSRFDAADSTGRALGVFLARGTVVRGGDVLVADDGSLVRVRAAAQPVLVVRGGAAVDLARAAYHLGNRHVAVELQADHLKIEPDHVLQDMLERMGLAVAASTEAFEPEAGAYQAEAAHRGHDHAHHGHGHDHHGHDRHDHEGHHDHDHGREGHDHPHG